MNWDGIFHLINIEIWSIKFQQKEGIQFFGICYFQENFQ